MISTPLRRTALVGAAMVFLAACGGRNGAAASSPLATAATQAPSVTATTATSSVTTATTSTTISVLASTLGSPGDAANATQTIVVHASDNFRFDPDSISVKVGETVTFQVVNAGTAEHEFLIGNSQAQAAEEKSMSAMQSGSPMVMPDDINVVYVPAGQSKSLTWMFTVAGTTLYGSHEGHDYAAGMMGTITVTP